MTRFIDLSGKKVSLGSYETLEKAIKVLEFEKIK
jgi:hypothetical protein